MFLAFGRMVVRILPPANNKCQCQLGMKFGCQPKNVVHLLRVAKELGVDVVGVRLDFRVVVLTLSWGMFCHKFGFNVFSRTLFGKLFNTFGTNAF